MVNAVLSGFVPEATAMLVKRRKTRGDPAQAGFAPGSQNRMTRQFMRGELYDLPRLLQPQRKQAIPRGLSRCC